MTPPEPHLALVARPALETRLREASETRRLITVVAGAGFGKSTLLARLATDLGWAWYTIHHADEELGRLAGGLADTLRLTFPEVAGWLGEESVVQSLAPGADERGRAEALGERLSEALRGVNRDAVLVLDDLHEIAPGSASARLIEAICRNAPSSFHLILASRTEPPFPVQRLRGRGQVFDLEASQLALTETETAELLAASLPDGDDELARSLHMVTGGWPAAIRAAIEALRDAQPTERASLVEGFARPGGPLFDYLAEEVFFGESPEIGRLLRLAGRFERFTASLLEHFGAERPGPTLLDLARRGLFVEPVPGEEGWFTLHSLARGFVLERWPLSGDELRTLHLSAAAWFESNGHIEEALRSLVAAEQHDEVSRLVGELGGSLLAGGAVEAVIRAAESLPPGFRDARVERAAGQAHAIRGQAGRALECFRRAAGSGGPIAASLAWPMMMALSFTDDLAEAVEVFDRTELEGADACDEAQVLGWSASIHNRLGRNQACGDLAARAMDAAARCGDDQALAEAHTALALSAGTEAEDAQPEAHLGLALEIAERSGNVLQIIRLRNNWGSVLLEACRYREALLHIDEAIRLAELVGYTKLRALGLLNRGLTYWGMGRLDEAAADYRNALTIYRQTGSLEACYALTGLGDIYRERGDVAMARACYDEALPLAERSGDLQGLVPALYQSARVLIDEEPARARGLAERAAAHGWPDHSWALNTVAWIALGRGEHERAERIAAQSGAEARTRHDLWGFAESLAVRAFCRPDPSHRRMLLEESLAVYREIGAEVRAAEIELALARTSGGPQALPNAAKAERTLRDAGVRATASRSAGVLWALARAEAEPVRVLTLGGFGVIRRGEPVARADWRSKKARDLLKILVARHGRPAPREYLMETLWPDEDPDKVSHRLSVALATLRTVLDPDRAFPPDRYVAGDAVSLGLEVANVSTDVDRFLVDAAAGLALLRQNRAEEARDLLQAAEARYSGDFLEEDAYEEWAAPLREEARAVYIQVVRALATEAEETGQPDSAIRYRLRLLELDPFDEDTHLNLVRTLDVEGHHGEARRRYRVYAARMEEIQVEPSPYPEIEERRNRAPRSGASRSV